MKTIFGAVALRAAGALIAAGTLAAGAVAQDAFIQLEADRTLEEAREAVERHGAQVGGVEGFAAVGGWYVVALGPYPAPEARARLDRLRTEGRAPADAFVTEGDLYRERFWPAGPAPEAPGAGAEAVAATPLPDGAASEGPAGEQTLRQALAAERRLDREARVGVQSALEAAGFYEGAIDAAFGAGTRRAMAEWQAARGHEVTGVLTTAQRDALRAEIEAAFEGLGMARVDDVAAGVSVEMPTEVLAFQAHETPLARYAATDGSGARLVLISQEGDERALVALYEVLQSLEIVPREGPREIEGDRFRLRGRDARHDTQGFARLTDGRIKGMILAWPAGDGERRDRLWTRMRESFETGPGVLGPAQATPAPEQRLDRLAGLAIREPVLSRSGVFVDASGAVLTTAEVAGDACGAILIDDAHEAEVAWSDERVALLRPGERLAPPRVAALSLEPGRLGSRVALAGFPFGAALDRPSVTFGRLEDLRGLGGEEALDRYALTAEPGDAGGPVLAEDGTVAGLLMPQEGVEGRAPPEGTAQGVDAARLAQALEAAGAAPSGAVPPRDVPAEDVLVGAWDEAAPMTPERLAREAAEITALVTCYD